jgi:hypothetical protein
MIDTWGQCYKTFYICDLQNVHKKLECLSLASFYQPSLMLERKAVAYLSKTPFTCSTLGVIDASPL